LCGLIHPSLSATDKRLTKSDAEPSAAATATWRAKMAVAAAAEAVAPPAGGTTVFNLSPF